MRVRRNDAVGCAAADTLRQQSGTILHQPQDAGWRDSLRRMGCHAVPAALQWELVRVHGDTALLRLNAAGAGSLSLYFRVADLGTPEVGATTP
ncbi:hypothetical protein M0638_17900 [Roseomonas sp. NAR14]|uniref:Uncharacterized protein n=1 Tax=Roseomonas acroporae TaxID=2937791 RepID=A0A9X2BV38_9PROT|nr:hypothetical protein [Roseomonas acroporae]MCK8786253.1 hypothetical protein [Roseomonas acroporae]